MPATWEIRDGVLYLRLIGIHGREEEGAALARALTSPDLPVPAPMIVDLSSSAANPSASQVAERAECLSTLRPAIKPRCALVVGDALRFGLARMFGAHADNYGIEAEVFWDETSARLWLASELPEADRDQAPDVAAPGARFGPSGRSRPSRPNQR